MKVLFVGEGPHDIGRDENAVSPPGLANGVLPILVRKVIPSIAPDSLAIKWREISLFSPKGKKFNSQQGMEKKVAAAILVSGRKFACDGTICVRDNDQEEGVAEKLEEGRKKGLQQVGGAHVAACGLAVQSIEAWGLGAPSALASVLGVSKADVEKQYRLRDVEEYYENSGKMENQPKKILENVAALDNRESGTEFRQAVADATDIEELEKNCPVGFKTFAQQLRAAFCT